MARNHSETYRRRNELAKEQGFKSYADKRKSLKVAQDSEEFQAYFPGISGRSSQEELDAAKTFREAFYTKKGRLDYGINGAKAKWFCEYEGIMTYDEWKQHYPEGTRYGR